MKVKFLSLIRINRINFYHLQKKKLLENEIKILEERKETFRLDEKEKATKIIELKDRKNELIAEIDELAPNNQVFRVATWLKGWFIIDYNKEIAKVNDQIIDLENQKVKSTTEKSWFSKIISIFIKTNNLDIEAIESQIQSLENQKKI